MFSFLDQYIYRLRCKHIHVYHIGTLWFQLDLVIIATKFRYHGKAVAFDITAIKIQKL